MNIFRQFQGKDDGNSSGKDGQERGAEAQENPVLRFKPIPCIEGMTWIEDNCLHKSHGDTDLSFRLPLKETLSIDAEWKFRKENLRHAQTSLLVFGKAGSISSDFGPAQYSGMIGLTDYLHRIFTKETGSALAAPGGALESVGPYACEPGLIWADRDFLYLGPSVSTQSTRAPIANLINVRARWDRNFRGETEVNLSSYSTLGGGVHARFTAKQAAGLFAVVNHINGLLTTSAE